MIIFANGGSNKNGIMAINKIPKKTTKPKSTRRANGQFGFGNEGRGKKWESPEKLQSDIDAYFKACDEHTKRELIFGKWQIMEHPKPYLIEGLCVALGINRVTLLNYEKQPGYEPYFSIIKASKEKVLNLSLIHI